MYGLVFVVHQGATFFTNNEVNINQRGFESNGAGAALFSSSRAAEPMIFSGPVTVSGNYGDVRGSPIYVVHLIEG